MLQRQNYDLLLLGEGILEPSKKKVSSLAKRLNPMMKIVLHYGGGSGLLKSELEGALQEDINEKY